MNSELESGFKTWLVEEGVAGEIFTGFTGEVQPSDSQTLTIFVPDCEHIVGPLYRATVRFIVSTPSHDDDDPQVSLANHRAKVGEVRALLQGFKTSTMKESLETSTAFLSRGGHLQNGGEATINGGDWLTTLVFVAGIATA